MSGLKAPCALTSCEPPTLRLLPSASVCATLPHHLSVLIAVSQKPGKLVPARGLCPGTSLPGMLSPGSLLGWLSLRSLLKTSPSLRSLLTTQSKAIGARLVTTFEQTKFKLYSWSSDSTDQNTQYDHNMWGKQGFTQVWLESLHLANNWLWSLECLKLELSTAYSGSISSARERVRSQLHVVTMTPHARVVRKVHKARVQDYC